MPGVTFPAVVFFEGTDLASSVRAASASISGANIVITPTMGLGTDVLTFVGVDFAAAVRGALPRIDAPGAKGFSEDITDAAGTAFDPKLTYDESLLPNPPIVLAGTSTANTQTWSRDLLEASILACDVLGL